MNATAAITTATAHVTLTAAQLGSGDEIDFPSAGHGTLTTRPTPGVNTGFLALTGTTTNGRPVTVSVRNDHEFVLTGADNIGEFIVVALHHADNHTLTPEQLAAGPYNTRAMVTNLITLVDVYGYVTHDADGFHLTAGGREWAWESLETITV